jgi:hypothetical protein
VIFGATSPTCTGGCIAVALGDGFAGMPHVGVTSDGTGSLFFTVSGTVNQVWRYTPATSTFAEVAVGGADAAGANASSFSFVDAKTNLLNLDSSGNLWIGDDPIKGATPNTGRIWTISSSVLAATALGGHVAPDPRVLAAIVGPWEALVENTVILPTLNADGTFTITIEPPAAPFTTDSGTWTLTPPVVPSQFLNPQAHLKLTNSAGVVLIEGDILLVRAGQFVMNNATGAITPFALFNVVFTKLI